MVVTGKKGYTMKREYTVIIEQDEAGWYVAEVPELYGCHTQAKSLDELMERVKEAIEVCNPLHLREVFSSFIIHPS